MSKIIVSQKRKELEVAQVDSDLVSHVRDKIGVDLSYFEFFTLLGYDYFAHSGVDVAVVEVGLGGKLDATNILRKSLLSILTSVDLDHTHVLGNTREEIASMSVV